MSKNTYTLTPQNQLIDLNGDLVNFDLTFSAVSKDGTPFNALVVDQQTLDNNPKLEHKVAENGSIGGNIIHDKNQYQNFSLVLKAHEQPCEVEVTIDKKSIEPNIQPQLTQPLYLDNAKPNSFSIWKWILILLVVIIFGFLLWKQFNVKKSSNFPVTDSVTRIPPQFYATPPDSPLVNNDLINRLNKLSTNFS